MLAVMTLPLSLVSANLSNPAHSITRLRQQSALRRIIRRRKRPLVIAVQEGHAGLRAPRGYRKYDAGGGVSELPIFVRRDITVTDHRWRKLVDGVAGHWPDRGYNEVRLVDGTWVMNVHPNSGIDAGGLPRTGEAWRVTATEHFPAVDAEIRRHQDAGDAVIVVGDWNVDRRADRRQKSRLFPYARMRSLRMVEAMYEGSSLGGRSVDRGFYDPRRLRLESSRLMIPVRGYDHRWPVYRFTRRQA